MTEIIENKRIIHGWCPACRVGHGRYMGATSWLIVMSEDEDTYRCRCRACGSCADVPKAREDNNDE